MKIITKGSAEIPCMKVDENGLFLQPFIRDKVITNDENMIILIDGRPRIGKSSTSICLAESLRKYGFYFPEDMSFVVEGTDEFIGLLDKDPPKHSVIVYEEAPVGHDSRTWGSEDNKDMNDILQTFGYRNIVLIMNGVRMNHLDKKARELIHLKLKMIKKDKKKGLVWAKPLWISYDDISGKLLRAYPKIRGEVEDLMFFPKCSAGAWKLYSAKKEAWNKNRVHAMKGRRMEEVKQKKGIDLDPIVKTVRENPGKFNTIAKISAAFNLPRRKAELIRGMVELNPTAHPV